MASSSVFLLLSIQGFFHSILSFRLFRLPYYWFCSFLSLFRNIDSWPGDSKHTYFKDEVFYLSINSSHLQRLHFLLAVRGASVAFRISAQLLDSWFAASFGMGRFCFPSAFLPLFPAESPWPPAGFQAHGPGAGLTVIF